MNPGAVITLVEILPENFPITLQFDIQVVSDFRSFESPIGESLRHGLQYVAQGGV